MPISRSDAAPSAAHAQPTAAVARPRPRGDAFAEHFGVRDVNCFHRCLANGCDRLRPGAGLLLLYLMSRDRACGHGPVPSRQQSGLDVAIRALARHGLEFELTTYADAGAAVAALPAVQGSDTVLALPTGTAGLSFLPADAGNTAHYLLVAAGDDGRLLYLESPIALAGTADGAALVEVKADRIELEEAMRCYPATAGASRDMWGSAWRLDIRADAGSGHASCTDILAELLADARHAIGAGAAMGFDAIMTEALEQRLSSGAGSAEANAACRAYLRDANFASLHLRAIPMAAARLSPEHADDADALTSRLVDEVSAARSKYLVKAMLGGAGPRRDAEAFLAQAATAWAVCNERLVPLLAEVLSRAAAGRAAT